MVMVFTPRMGIAQSQVPATTYQEAVKAKIAADTLRNPKSISVFGQQRQEEEKTYGIGFQTLYSVGNTGNTISVWGISGMADVTPNMSIQLIIAPFGPGLSAPFGDPKMYAGKFIYRYKKKLYWNAYAYGMVSALDYYKTDEEFDLFAGVGTGIEGNWKALYSGLPSIAWSLEIGIGKGNLKEISNVSIISGGAHYRF